MFIIILNYDFHLTIYKIREIFTFKSETTAPLHAFAVR